MRLLFIMWRLSLLCQVAGGAPVPAYVSYRWAARRFVRLSHARESRWIANRASLRGARQRVDRGMRDVSVETAWRREEQPKTDGSFAYARYERVTLPTLLHSRRIRSRESCLRSSPSCVTRVVALAVAYRYGYGIRHTSQSTNGYFAETTSRFLQEMPSPPGRGRVITNDEGGKSRSNFLLREPKEAFGSTNSGGSVEWQTTYLTHKNNNENILRWRN